MIQTVSTVLDELMPIDEPLFAQSTLPLTTTEIGIRGVFRSSSMLVLLLKQRLPSR